MTSDHYHRPSLGSTPFTSAMLARMQELKESMRELPTTYVMTEETWERAKRRLEEARGVQFGQPTIGAAPLTFGQFGTPVEVYPTMAECHRRLLDMQEGERLCLVHPNWS